MTNTEITRKEFFKLLFLIFTTYFFGGEQVKAFTTQAPKRRTPPKDIQGTWIRLIFGDEGSVDIIPNHMDYNVLTERVEITSWDDVSSGFRKYAPGLIDINFKVELPYDPTDKRQVAVVGLLNKMLMDTRERLPIGYEIHLPGGVTSGLCELWGIDYKFDIDESMRVEMSFHDITPGTGPTTRILTKNQTPERPRFRMIGGDNA